MASDVFGIVKSPVPGREKTIVVLGAPRGGTSMVAATLRKLGVMMGEHLGHQHEDRLFRQEVPIREKIATIIDRNQKYPIWGWKLPNTIYYLDEVLPYLRNPYFVAVFRNPYSISRSSSERDKRDYDFKLLQVAVTHTKKVVDILAKLDAPIALASFESAMKEPFEFVRSLAEFIGAGNDPQAVRMAAEAAVNSNHDYLKF